MAVCLWGSGGKKRTIFAIMMRPARGVNRGKLTTCPTVGGQGDRLRYAVSWGSPLAMLMALRSSVERLYLDSQAASGLA
jgi:hypothetical protein